MMFAPRRSAWHATPPSTNQERRITALQEQARLEDSLMLLSKLTQAGTTDMGQLNDLVQSAAASNNLLRNALQAACRPAELLRSASPRTIDLLHQILDISELLEMILASLSIPRLLGARAVSRTWKAAIDTSPNLQRILCHSPQSPTGQFRLPFRDEGLVSRFASSTSYDSSSSDGAAKHTVTAVLGHFYGSKTRKIGSAIRSMLVCQSPVITSMTARLDCWYRHDVSNPESLTIRNRHGLTLGDIFDAYQKITPDHQHCDVQFSKYNLSTGARKVRISFEGHVVLASDNKYLVEKQRLQQQKDLEAQEFDRLSSDALAWNQQKRAAQDLGQEFPSFEGWRKAKDVDGL